MKKHILLLAICAAALLVIISASAHKLRPSPPAIDEVAFIESARQGDEAGVRNFLGLGMSPNTRDPRDQENSTVLMVAAMAGQINVVKTLAGAGADVNATTSQGRTALMFASWKGQTQSVQTLLSNGANVNAQDSRGATALHYAISERHPETIKPLIDNGADRSNLLAFAVAVGDPGVVQVLLSKSLDPNPRDRLGRTALMIAIDKGNPDMVEVLLAGGADVNVKDPQNRSTLLLARATGQKEIVQALLARGAVSGDEKSWP